MTTKDMTLLLIRYLKVKNKGWIKSLRRGPTGIGYTFETLIGKQEENLPIADFRGIEIKVKRRYSKGNITLFTANPDNEIFAIKRIYNEYGTYNYNKNFHKTFITSINSFEKKRKGNYNFIIKVDEKKQKIKLEIYDLNNNLVEDDISWSYELIKEKIYFKIKNLAIVKAHVKKIGNEELFNYNHIDFYEIKSFETFVRLIKEGLISITFNINVYMDKKRYGNIYNHGTAFIININNIEKLYQKKDFQKK